MKKKLLSLLLALAMVFTLAACGEKKPDPGKDATATEPVVILHTNDVHCAVGEADEKGATPLGYSALASYVADRKGVFGSGNVTLVDAGDAVQGNAMGTLTQGQALVDIMNATGYDYVIPGNHEFDYGMPQFNHLVGSANATYLSCNFTDKRPEVPTLMFAPYAIQDYPLASAHGARGVWGGSHAGDADGVVAEIVLAKRRRPYVRVRLLRGRHRRGACCGSAKRRGSGTRGGRRLRCAAGAPWPGRPTSGAPTRWRSAAAVST